MTQPRVPQRLLLVMPSARLVRKAVTAGFMVWSVWDPALEEDAYLDDVEWYSTELLLADFSDSFALRSLVAATAREHDIDLILHMGGEDTRVAVVEEAEAPEVAPGHAPGMTLRGLQESGDLRALLDGNGFSVLRLRREPSADPAFAIAGPAA